MRGEGAGQRFTLAEMPVPMVYASYRIIRDCNQEFLDLFGYRIADLLDKSFALLYPKQADFIRIGKMWRTHLSGGSVYFDERIMTASDGRRFWCQVHGRSFVANDPMAQVVYCFQPIARPVVREWLALTDRQMQIVALIAQGKTSETIAQELGLSRRTIESHRSRLLKAAGLSNSGELVARFFTAIAGDKRP